MRRLVWLEDCMHGYQSCSFGDCTGGRMESIGCPKCGAPVVDRTHINDLREERGAPRGVDVECSQCDWFRRRIFDTRRD